MFSKLIDNHILKNLIDPDKNETWFEYKKDYPFEYGNKNRSLINALWLGECMRICYIRDVKRIEKILKKAGFNKFVWFDKNSSQAFVASNRHTVIVCFRGTELSSWTDIKADLKGWRVKHTNGGRVHAGFREALFQIHRDIYHYVEDERKGKTLWVTGHSLGAAMATIFASYVECDGLYTYGSPRVGNWKFAREVNKRLTNYRFVNNNDIVPTVPWPFLYRHTKHLELFSKDAKIITNPSFWQIMNISRILQALNFFKSIDEHDPPNYVKKLRKNVIK